MPNADSCSASVKTITTDVVAMVEAIAGSITSGNIDVMSIIDDLGKIAEDFATGLCPAPSATQFLAN